MIRGRCVEEDGHCSVQIHLIGRYFDPFIRQETALLRFLHLQLHRQQIAEGVVRLCIHTGQRPVICDQDVIGAGDAGRLILAFAEDIACFVGDMHLSQDAFCILARCCINRREGTGQRIQQNHKDQGKGTHLSGPVFPVHIHSLFSFWLK